tara:strand:- start:1027 stop:1428 length:402 start_codon:yes stop_codon:yes gene_type:complete
MSKTVIVYNFEQTCSAMKAAKKLKKKIYISSPDNAGSYMGPLFFKQLVFNASKLFPKVDYSEILNCSNDIGIALEAIECGIKNIEINCNKNIFEKIKNICKKKGVGINTINNKKLDLKNVKNTYDECLKWFKI